MYCPECFDSGLKPASNGIIKMTFNGKSKSNSQFVYDTNRDLPEDIYQKLREVVIDYFKWYSTFQNKDKITHISVFSSSFVCRQGCTIGINHRLNVLDIFLNIDVVKSIIEEEALNFKIEVDLKSLQGDI